MISPRFFGDAVLQSCLAGHRIFAGSGDPPASVALVQQALADLGFAVAVDGTFGTQTGTAVTGYKTGKGLVPNDPVVGPGTMAALDADFAHELFDAKAAALSGTKFDLGGRTGTRVEVVDGFATCAFENGVGVEVGHAVCYAMPSAALQAWTDAGGLEGEFGVPTGDPFELDASRSAQSFTFVVHLFGDNDAFTLPRALWEGTIAGGSLIGQPLEPPQATGDEGAIFVPHESGVVLAAPDESPQPLPQVVFDLWNARAAAGSPLGAPTAFAFPSDAGQVFSFRSGNITLNNVGVASLTEPVDGTLQRYFQPEDDALFLQRPMRGTVATALIGGAAVLSAMRADIAAANGATDFIYIASWHCNIDLQLVSGDSTSTLRSLLASRAAAGVQLRAMLWAGDPVPAPPTIVRLAPPQISVPWQLAKDYARTKTSRVVNEPAVNFINGLAGSGLDTAAILDDRHLPSGSHHQKIVVVKAGGKLIAYVGGIEANVDRLSSVPGESGSPLFDASVRLEDAGAWLVLRSFILRWDIHPAALGSPLRGGSMPVPPHSGPLAVQVTHTYGKGFPFQNAVQTASTALANGIRSARQFFYMEDQYFVGSPKMTAAISSAMSANPTLVGIIVIAAEFSVSDLPDLPFRRRAFLASLANAFPGRILVFERLGSGSPIGPTAYVHTKLLVVDDEAALIGSVNSSRRSWFHDSEIDATIVDTTGTGGAAPGTRGWVRNFRAELWSRHLNVSSALLGDFVTCLAVWQAVISGQLVLLGGNFINISSVASVRSYDVNATAQRYAVAGVPLSDKLLELAWDTLEDPAS
jgi:phosphatidylserine/phosphatidylglycerophosphate/cardiolipin synthase-like enzyme